MMITCVILVRNEAMNIIPCIEAIRRHVDEIILIDMESSDATVKLARPLVDKILNHPLISNFDSARNIAIDQAAFDWLWFVDADERVPDQVGQLIRQLVTDSGDE